MSQAQVTAPPIKTSARIGVPTPWIYPVSSALTVQMAVPVMQGGGTVAQTAVPAMDIRVQLAMPASAQSLMVAPFAVSVVMQVPTTADASLVLTSPVQDEVVPTTQPQFVVGLQSPDLYAQFQVEIQYATDAAFTAPMSAVLDVQAVDGGVTYIPASAVFTTTYWRARLLQDAAIVIDWIAPSRFTVDQVSGEVSLPVMWSVDATAERPAHLWHFDPPGVEEGDEVIVYGQGFPLTPGSLILYGQPVGYDSWTLVAASDAAATPDRVIDGDVVDAEHFEVAFLAPPVEEPGGPLTVEA